MIKKDTEKQILIDLLALSAVEPLSNEDEQKMAQLLTKYPEFSKDEFAEITALSLIHYLLIN